MSTTPESRSDPSAPRIPVLEEQTPGLAVRRGRQILRELERFGVRVAGRTVADLGSGLGAVAVAAAELDAHRVIAVDVDERRLAAARALAKAQGVSVETVRGNLLLPPFKASIADVAFLIGVVEYAGLWDTERSVRSLQVEVLKSARSVLRPDGLLVLASKNRLWPGLLRRDVHTKLPLVHAMPPWLANRLSIALRREPFRHRIYSPEGWKRLVRSAGFSQVTALVPYFSYQFPIMVSPHGSLEDLRRLRRRAEGMSDLEGEARALAFPKHWRWKAALMAAAGSAGIQLGHNVVLIARA